MNKVSGTTKISKNRAVLNTLLYAVYQAYRALEMSSRSE
jgi:hypothetical protein